MAAATVTTHIAAVGTNLTQAAAEETEAGVGEEAIVGARSATTSTPSAIPPVALVHHAAANCDNNVNDNDADVDEDDDDDDNSFDIMAEATVTTLFIDNSTQTDKQNDDDDYEGQENDFGDEEEQEDGIKTDTELEKEDKTIVEARVKLSEIAEEIEEEERADEGEQQNHNSAEQASASSLSSSSPSPQDECTRLYDSLAINVLEEANAYAGDSPAVNCDNCDLEQNYTYEERIIDFDNFRIIEHVIDCPPRELKKRCSASVKMKMSNENQNCTAHNQTANENSVESENVVSVCENENSATDESKELNFACRELVSFIGESYQIIDNARVFQGNANGNEVNAGQSAVGRDNDEEEETYCVGAELYVIDNETAHDNVEYSSTYASATPSTTNNNINTVDDNNNTSRGAAAMRLMNSIMQNCDREPDKNRLEAEDIRENGTKVQMQKVATMATATTSRPEQQNQKTSTKSAKYSSATVMKAFKSKLTPLAPPFQPAAVKAKITAAAAVAAVTSAAVGASASAAAASTMYAYEQTTVYYQQQQQQQQLMQHQQQANMLHTLNLQQQSQQVSPTHQQRQHNQQHQQQLQLQKQQQHFVPSNAHQQHCVQHNNNALAGVPHIHLHAPVQVISLASPQIVAANAAASHMLGSHGNSVGNGAQQNIAVPGGAWPLVEAPIYIDANGEYRTYCPAHGPPPPPVAAVAAAAAAAAAAAPHTNATAASSLSSLPTTSVNVPPTTNVATLVTHHQHQHHQHNHNHNHHQQHQQQHNHHQQQHFQKAAAVAVSATSSPTSATAAATASSAASSSSSAATSASRILLQLDTAAGASPLPLQIAGKRKVYRGE